MATGNLGNLTIGLILNTDKFSKGAKGARKDLFGIKSSAMDLKNFFLKGFLGIAGFNSLSNALKKGFRDIKDDMKHLEKFSTEERERIIKLNAEILRMETSWKQVSKAVSTGFLPVLSAAAKFVDNLVQQLKMLGVIDGDTRSGTARKALIDSMTGEQFAGIKKDWQGMTTGVGRWGVVRKHFGADAASGGRRAEIEAAIEARIRREASPKFKPRTDFSFSGTSGTPFHGISTIAPAIANWLRSQPAHASTSLGAMSRMKSLVDSMDIAGNVPKPGQRRKFEMTGGLSALEKGSAEAFSQEKRGQQMQQQLMEVKKQTKVQEKMEAHLRNIDTNIKKVSATEAAQFNV